MLFPRLNRDIPERVFIVVENNEGGTMAANATCQLDLTSEVDGVKARYVDDGQQYAFLGIVDAAIADNEWGLVQVYGYRSTTNVQHLAQVGTAAATALGALWAFAAESSPAGTGSSTPKIFLRAL